MGKILVKTPITSNGRDIVLGQDGRPRYRETILNDQPGRGGARAALESINRQRPPVLRHIIESYNDADNKPIEKEVVQNKDGSVTVTKKVKANAKAS